MQQNKTYTFTDNIKACEAALVSLQPITDKVPGEYAGAAILVTNHDEDAKLAEKLFMFLHKGAWAELSLREKLILSIRLVFTKDYFARSLERGKNIEMNSTEAMIAIIGTAFDYWRVQAGLWFMDISGSLKSIGNPSFSMPNISAPTRDHIIKFIETL